MVKKFIQYGGVAAGSAGVDWLIFIFLTVAGVYHVTAIVFSRIGGGIFSFFMNRIWTFTARDGRHVSIQGRRFLLLYGVSYLMAIGVLYFLADMVGISAYLAKLCADTLCFLFNFGVMKAYVYHERAGISERVKTALDRLG